MYITHHRVNQKSGYDQISRKQCNFEKKFSDKSQVSKISNDALNDNINLIFGGVIKVKSTFFFFFFFFMI